MLLRVWRENKQGCVVEGDVEREGEHMDMWLKVLRHGKQGRRANRGMMIKVGRDVNTICMSIVHKRVIKQIRL